jgi:hypothetical protein
MHHSIVSISGGTRMAVKGGGTEIYSGTDNGWLSGGSYRPP